MHIFEFMTGSEPENLGYYDPNEDKMAMRSRDDTRKSKLMLKDINRLKKIRAQSKLEALKRQDLLDIMYGDSGEDSGGGGFGGF